MSATQITIFVTLRCRSTFSATIQSGVAGNFGEDRNPRGAVARGGCPSPSSSYSSLSLSSSLLHPSPPLSSSSSPSPSASPSPSSSPSSSSSLSSVFCSLWRSALRVPPAETRLTVYRRFDIYLSRSYSQRLFVTFV